MSYTHHFFLSSPHSHLAVHHTREIKLCQQILHLVVFLTVLLYVSMVTGDIWAQHIPHQEGQTALLTFTVFLSGEKSRNVLIKTANQKQHMRQVIYMKVILTFSIRPLAPALKLPVKRHTFKAFPGSELIFLTSFF